jgi:prepilin-type N-terminal cleavage/methylation domain-containing protein
MNIFSKNKDTKLDSGFTLIELLVTIAIAVGLMAIVIFDYSTFNDRLALSSAGQEIAIEIRRAQVYGINVRENSVGSSQFNAGYGIFFNKNTSSNAYYVFTDMNNNNRYGDTVGSCGGVECLEKVTLRDGITISAITSTSCVPFGTLVGLHVTFKRPNPDAIIKLDESDGPACNSTTITNTTVTLRSPKGRLLNVNIEDTGQIYIQ